MRIDAKGIYYKDLNDMIHRIIENGEREIILDNVNGQRYIGAGLKGSDIKITIFGTPGNDLACFMDGPTIVVNSNGQDGIGNTMNSGKIIVYGDAGDITGHSMRGGKIYIKGDSGYRVGIHMKAYKDLYPIIIIGGSSRDFLGEYMAGGLIIVLGLNEKDSPVGNYVGTGMHGGKIYIRRNLEDYQLGKEVKKFSLDEKDRNELNLYLKEYCQDFGLDLEEILKDEFIKLSPFTHRPYGKLYAY
ncbi:MAG: hypothetical protein NC928_05965 [Candidatus Omnitrophica bacterium]|nr:hypothetical protein [Candidatus Omnitrophota bacterium]